MAKIAAARRERIAANVRRQDPTLQHPRCVFQVLKKHFARYTPEMVERYCGVPKDAFLKAAKTFCVSFGAGEDRRHLLCALVGRSIQVACRSSALRRFCNCCWAISGGPAAAFWRCAAMPPSKARPIFQLCTTSCPAICPCRYSERSRKLCRLHRKIRGHARAGGTISTNISSAC